MQKYKEINGNDYVKNSRTTINETMQSIQSMNSGTAFPTNNLFEGMKCYRTDLKKTYTLTDVENNTWVEDAHATLSDEATHAASATKLQTARSLNLGGAVTADAATFDGTANATINVKTLDATKLKGTASVSTTGNAATATKVVATAAAGASANIAEATMASSDSARIRVSGATNAGELALETAADGSEPIVARQYTGAYTNAVRTAKILDESGNTSFPGTVVAPNFTGSLNGNAATATKLSTARKINITGNATGAATFDGSGDISISTTVNESKHAAAADVATKANDSAKLGGYPLTVGDRSYGAVPLVRPDGVMEVGKYIDWHVTSGGTKDYSSRWEAKNDGTVSVGTINGALNGNAATATKLATPRAISLTGNASGSANFDGSGDIDINTTVNESKHAASATALDIYAYRPDDANIQKGDGLVRHFLATSAMSKNKPPEGDGHILSFAWDYNGGYDAQLCVNNMTGHINMRGQNAGKWSDWLTVLDSANFNSYAPTKTGGGASGTWGISISGTATKVYGMYTGKGGQQGPGYFGTNSAGCLMSNQSVNGHTEFKNWLYMDNYEGTDAGGATAIGISRTETRAYIMSSNADRKQWGRTAELLSSANYNSFAPTKTGGGASGTWGIDISGNAASATTATKANTASSVAWSGITGKPGTYPPSAHNHDSAYPSVTGTRASGTWGIDISGNAASATNADKVDGYHASDIISKIQDITPKTAAAIGQFRELVVNDSHQVKLPGGGTWAYFVYTYNSWSGDDSNGEHRTRTGAGIAAGGTVLHTDGNITSNTINAFKLSGTTGAGGADDNNIIVGGFCWRIA